MERIASFSVDHNVLTPGLYISRRDANVTTYDMRFKKPNTGDLLSNAEMHSCEHIMATLLRNSQHKDAIVYFGPMGCQTGFYFLFDNEKMTDAEAIEGGYRLTVPGGTVETRCVINAAGIWADKVHSMVEPANFHIIPTRGEYYLLDKSEGTRVSHVIFQCPNELGKGVLVAPTVHGNLIVGPNAEPVEGNDTSCTSSGLEFVKATAQRSVPSINFGESIRSFAGVRANLDVDDFIIGEEPEAPGWIDLAGMKSPGLSAAPAVAEEAVNILQQRGVLGAEKADYKDGRRHIRFKELSAEEKAALVKEQPAYGRVICRCETITEGEILAALHSEVPANTIDGVKRRAGAGMGRCQGGFCGPRVLELISRELGMSPMDILQDKNGSNVLVSETKVGGKSNG